ncbi:MAG TPA: hypothetical protein ENF70_00245 [Deltaproteobacteria bacterium]|nr:hypothetical protein [Deltaproteobacteria bacterium]
MHDMQVNLRYSDPLSDLGLDNFDSVWNLRGLKTVKQLRDRSVEYYDFFYRGKNRRFYPKRHIQESLSPVKIPLGGLRGADRDPQGILEFENICEFRARSFCTVEPVADCQKVIGPSQVISFLITEDFSPYLQLQSLFLEQRRFLEGLRGHSGGTY